MDIIGPTEIIEDDKPSQLHKKLIKDALKYKEKLEKRGVIYLSRVPPFMKPNKVRSLLEKYGEVTRLYLAEEEAIQRRRRKEHGGNGSKQFKEGWIEFSEKQVAKEVAASLNNCPIGGKKGGYYHDDIWNLKYLKGFKWDYLTEKLAYERRTKESKLSLSMMQAKKTNAEIIEQIEQGIVKKHIESRKRSREDGAQAIEQPSADSDKATADEAQQRKAKLHKKFRQSQAIGQDYGQSIYKAPKKLLERVFSKSIDGGGAAADGGVHE